VFAVIHAEGADVVATYESAEEASDKLAEFVAAHPTMQDEIGLRQYEDGRPAGAWMSAAEVLQAQIAQPHLAV
jgi:hypothetical protein